MEKRNIEKLIADLKTLPRVSAPENLEEVLIKRIVEFENKKVRRDFVFRKYRQYVFNPIFVPALSIILVAFLIVITIKNNQTNTKNLETNIEKAIPIVQESQEVIKSEPQRISIPKRKDYVVKRYKPQFELGPGTSLDEPDYSSDSKNITKPSFVGFPLNDEAITIRIPPPEVIFKEEFEKIGVINRAKDSVKPINSRNR